MSEVFEKAVAELNLDKSDWQLVKFGDVAIQQKQTVDRENTELTRYVKGEHMYSEDIHLRAWGELKNEYLGPAFIRKFEEGDILYGSRRTYLRKVVIAPFDGITSNTTFVIKANEKRIDKRLIPFIMMSEGFTQHSIKNSKGSVNPYVNWKDLSGYEFLLPPKGRQTELVELLWAIDGVIEKDITNESNLKSTPQTIFKNALYEDCDELDRLFLNRTSKYEVKKLEELITEIQYGISESLSEEPNSGVPILRMNNLQGGKLELTDLKYFKADNGELDKFILHKGDILFNRTNSFELVGKVSLFDEDGVYSFASYLIRIKTDKKKLDPRFLSYYLNSAIGLAKVRKYRTPGVSQSNINAQNLKGIPIPYPDIEIQKELMDRIELFQSSEKNIVSKIDSSRTLQKSLINLVF